MDSPVRRNTRSALLDLSRNLQTGTSPTASSNIPDSYLTPSPDEQVIRQRGRRKTESMTADGTLLRYLQTSVKTPTKSCIKSPIKRHSLPTRTSPRKRLNLDDTSEVVLDELPSLIFSPSKRVRIACSASAKSKSGSTQEWASAIKGLSKDQLVDLIVKLVEKNPDLEEDVMEDMPAPDIRELENNLILLKKNIYKSFPYTKWGSNRNAFCYRRVSTHLTTFKKTCVDHGKQLLSCSQWIAAIDYVLMAWNYVSELPDWDEEAHNKLKQMCYKSLATLCMNALKKGKLGKDYYEQIETRLINAKSISREIEPCVALVSKLTEK